METYLIYIDESYDNDKWVYSCIFVPISKWKNIFRCTVSFRKRLKEEYGPIESELHATKFIGNRGISNPMTKEYRAKIFKKFLYFVETLHKYNVSIINGITTKGNESKLFEWILNRVQRTLHWQNAYGILICDEGNENRLINTVRRMQKQILCHRR